MPQTTLNSLPQNYLSASEFAGGMSPLTGTREFVPLDHLTDWQLAMELLPDIDDKIEYHRPADIVKVLGDLSPDTLCNHAKTIWRDHTGHWRFSTEDAQRLIRKYIRNGHRRFPRETLEFMVHNKRQSRALA